MTEDIHGFPASTTNSVPSRPLLVRRRHRTASAAHTAPSDDRDKHLRPATNAELDDANI
jgi:hypothetical protein